MEKALSLAREEIISGPENLKKNLQSQFAGVVL